MIAGDGPEDIKECAEFGESLDLTLRCDNEIIEVMWAQFRRAIEDRTERGEPRQQIAVLNPYMLIP